MREAGAKSLGDMGAKAKERAVVDALLSALRDDDDAVQLAAGEALRKIDPVEAAKAGVQ